MPEISIVVPVYNTEQYLRRCVDSLLAQSFFDIEIILVDDGSTDSSGEHCDEYARMDSRVRVVHQRNQGLSGARNTGIIAARGKYVCFVDSDDFVSPDFAEMLFHGAKETKAEIVACDFLRFSDENEIRHEEDALEKGWKTYSIKEAKRDGFLPYVVCGRIIDKKIFSELLFAKLENEDVAFNKSLFVDFPGITIAFSPMKLYYYFQRQESMQHTLMRGDSYTRFLHHAEYYYFRFQNVSAERKCAYLLLARDYALNYRYVTGGNPNGKHILKTVLSSCLDKKSGISKKERIKTYIFVRFPWIYAAFRMWADRHSR